MAKDPTVDPRVTRTRHAVLAAAREVLLDEGWEGVTLGRVAERSGYARTTLYRHWPQRLDLLRDLIREEARLAHTTPMGDLRDDLVAELEAPFDSCLANLYRDGADSMGWHSDDEPELGPRPTIASVSLGARRRFLLRHRASGQRWSVELGEG